MPESRLHFLVIGAQKCATSWLYDCLNSHPGIHLPDKKKEVEYLGGDLYEQNGAEWYFGLVKNPTPGEKLGDVSVNYMSDPRSPAVVHQYLPDIQLIACLRDPIDRAVSGYYWYSRKNKIPEAPVEVGLERAVNPPPDLDAVAKAAYEDILARGFYDEQLARYREFVPADRMHYILYDDVSSDPAKVLRDAYCFIGVDETFLPASISSKPKKNTYFKPLIALERLAPRSRFAGKAADIANQFLQKMNVGTEKPELPKSVSSKLLALYEPHVKETQRIVNESRVKAQQVDLTRLWLEKWR